MPASTAPRPRQSASPRSFSPPPPSPASRTSSSPLVPPNVLFTSILLPFCLLLIRAGLVNVLLVLICSALLLINPWVRTFLELPHVVDDDEELDDAHQLDADEARTGERAAAAAAAAGAGVPKHPKGSSFEGEVGSSGALPRGTPTSPHGSPGLRAARILAATSPGRSLSRQRRSQLSRFDPARYLAVSDWSQRAAAAEAAAERRRRERAEEEERQRRRVRPKALRPTRMHEGLRRPLDELTDLVIRDFVKSWYMGQTLGHPSFPRTCHFSIDEMVDSIHGRIMASALRSVDLASELVLTSSSVVLSALRARRRQGRHRPNAAGDGGVAHGAARRPLDPHMDPRNPHASPAAGQSSIWPNTVSRVDSLRVAVGALLERHMPAEEKESHLVMELLRELLTKHLWGLICAIGEPDFINRKIVEWAEGGQTTPGAVGGGSAPGSMGAPDAAPAAAATRPLDIDPLLLGQARREAGVAGAALAESSSPAPSGGGGGGASLGAAPGQFNNGPAGHSAAAGLAPVTTQPRPASMVSMPGGGGRRSASPLPLTTQPRAKVMPSPTIRHFLENEAAQQHFVGAAGNLDRGTLLRDGQAPGSGAGSAGIATRGAEYPSPRTSTDSRTDSAPRSSSSRPRSPRSSVEALDPVRDGAAALGSLASGAVTGLARGVGRSVDLVGDAIDEFGDALVGGPKAEGSRQAGGRAVMQPTAASSSRDAPMVTAAAASSASTTTRTQNQPQAQQPRASAMMRSPPSMQSTLLPTARGYGSTPSPSASPGPPTYPAVPTMRAGSSDPYAAGAPPSMQRTGPATAAAAAGKRSPVPRPEPAPAPPRRSREEEEREDDIARVLGAGFAVPFDAPPDVARDVGLPSSLRESMVRAQRVPQGGVEEEEQRDAGKGDEGAGPPRGKAQGALDGARGTPPPRRSVDGYDIREPDASDLAPRRQAGSPPPSPPAARAQDGSTNHARVVAGSSERPVAGGGTASTSQTQPPPRTSQQPTYETRGAQGSPAKPRAGPGASTAGAGSRGSGGGAGAAGTGAAAPPLAHVLTRTDSDGILAIRDAFEAWLERGGTGGSSQTTVAPGEGEALLRLHIGLATIARLVPTDNDETEVFRDDAVAILEKAKEALDATPSLPPPPSASEAEHDAGGKDDERAWQRGATAGVRRELDRALQRLHAGRDAGGVRAAVGGLEKRLWSKLLALYQAFWSEATAIGIAGEGRGGAAPPAQGSAAGAGRLAYEPRKKAQSRPGSAGHDAIARAAAAELPPPASHLPSASVAKASDPHLHADAAPESDLAPAPLDVTVTDVSANAERLNAPVDPRTLELMVAVEGLTSETGGFVLVRVWSDFELLDRDLGAASSSSSTRAPLPPLPVALPDARRMSSLELSQSLERYLVGVLSSPPHVASAATQHFLDKTRAAVPTAASAPKTSALLQSLNRGLNSGAKNFASGVEAVGRSAMSTLQRPVAMANSTTTSTLAAASASAADQEDAASGGGALTAEPGSYESNGVASRAEASRGHTSGAAAPATTLYAPKASLGPPSEHDGLPPRRSPSQDETAIEELRAMTVGERLARGEPLDAHEAELLAKRGDPRFGGAGGGAAGRLPRSAGAGGSGSPSSELSQRDLDAILSAVFAIADEAFSLSGGWTLRRGMLRVLEQIVRTQYASSVLSAFNGVASALSAEQLGQWANEVRLRWWPPPEGRFVGGEPGEERTEAMRRATAARARKAVLAYAPAQAGYVLGPGGKQACERALSAVHDELTDPLTSLDLGLMLTLRLLEIAAR